MPEDVSCSLVESLYRPLAVLDLVRKPVHPISHRNRPVRSCTCMLVVREYLHVANMCELVSCRPLASAPHNVQSLQAGWGLPAHDGIYFVAESPVFNGNH